MAKVLVIDVGTHKAEEVRLFEGRPRLTARNRYRAWRRGGPRATAQIKRQALKFTGRFSFRYVLVEPVAHPELLDFLRDVPSALLFKGVVSCGASGPAALLLANASLGHSIIPTKPGLSGRKVETYNINFPALYELLIDAYVDNGDCDRVVLRMNAEGVEGPIVDFLADHASRKPDVLAGSLGDIRKCFGQEAYEQANGRLEEAGIPFVYFTSNVTTWASGLREIANLLQS